MLTKKQQFDLLIKNGSIQGGFLFRPILMHFAARYHSITYGELASDYKKLVEANIHCMEDFDTDMVGLISDPYRETSAFGAPVEFIKEGVPKCNDIIIKTTEDVRRLKNPDITKAFRTLDRIKGVEYYQKLLKAEVPVIGWVEGPLAEACDLAGVSEVLMKLMIDPDFINLLLDKTLQTAIDFAHAQINAGCDVIGIGDAICSQIDPTLYELFVKERHRQLITSIHDKGAKVKMHICGDITHLIPSLKDLSIDILDIDWQVNPQKTHEILGPKVILCGNINPIDIQNQTQIELAESTSNLLQKENNQPFILSGGCEITVFTPVENLKILRSISKI